MGGLGNQLFQYASAKSLALKNQTELLIDTTFYTDVHQQTTIRNFELDKFNLSYSIATKRDLDKFRNNRFSLLDIFKLKVLTLGKFNKYKESDLQLDQGFLNLQGNLYLRGFFQNEVYFQDIRKQLVKEITPKIDFDVLNKTLIHSMEIMNSVSVHIRRGDHLHFANNNFHGVCSKTYYEKAFEIIHSKVKNPVFFYFTDDHEWVKQNFELNELDKIVDHNKRSNSYYDLLLMKYCKHNIIANSSFSWWGAWLNENDSKIVIGPDKWYLEQSLRNINHCCKDWISIDPHY